MDESSNTARFNAEAFAPGLGREMLKVVADAARDYRNDPDFRARIEADPRAELEARSMHFEPDDLEVRLYVDTPEVFHLVIAADPNAAVSDQFLDSTVGGSTASSAGSVGSVSTASSFPSCVGSGASVSCVGSGGSATGD